MSAGAFVFARLANQTDAASRIYPQLLPQQPTFPAVTYQQISAIRIHAMGQDSGLLRVRLQVNAWAKTYAEARALAGQIEARLARFRGTEGGATISDVLLDNELETYESDTQTRRVAQDYTIYISAPQE